MKLTTKNMDKIDTTKKAVLQEGRGSIEKRPGLSDGEAGSARGGDVENGLEGPGK